MVFSRDKLKVSTAPMNMSSHYLLSSCELSSLATGGNMPGNLRCSSQLGYGKLRGFQLKVLTAEFSI